MVKNIIIINSVSKIDINELTTFVIDVGCVCSTIRIYIFRIVSAIEYAYITLKNLKGLNVVNKIGVLQNFVMIIYFMLFGKLFQVIRYFFNQLYLYRLL